MFLKIGRYSGRLRS